MHNDILLIHSYIIAGIRIFNKVFYEMIFSYISSGIDVISILQAMGVGESLLTSRVATGASTFVIAYAVHKVFAPVRIAITLTSAPFIVRYLRLRGLLKPPAPK